MNAYYTLSVAGSRLFGLATVVVLSYLLSPHEFGVFVLISTNALLIHLLFSSWISNSSWRDISVLDGLNRTIRISNSLVCAAAFSLIPLATAVAVFTIDFERFQYIGIILILAIVILFYELTLVIKNAQGLSREYSIMSSLRGILTFGFSVSLAAWGLGLRGAVWGQIIGTILAIVCRRSFWAMFRHIKLSNVSWTGITGQLKFGLISAFALNLYLTGNALSRDLILLGLGEAEAGYFSLSADMFYAPIALFATALSLSSIPELYRSASNDAVPTQAADFIAGVVAIAIPYAMAGVFLGSSVANLLLGSDISPHISQIAPHSIIHAACFCILSTQTTVALTKGRLKVAVALPVATLALLASVLLGMTFTFGPDGITLLLYAQAVTITLLPVTIAMMLASRSLFQVSIPWGECLRVLGASAAMCLALAAIDTLSLPFAPFPAIALGGATFVGAAWLLGSRVVRNLVRLSLA